MHPDAIDEGIKIQLSISNINCDEIVYSVGSDCTNLNQCRITVSFNLRQTSFSLHMLYCEILATAGPLSLTQIHIWQQHLYFTETSWLALHEEKAGDNLMLQPCA